MSTLFVRFPGGLLKALTFSYDDGVESDARFMEILDKYGMKGTFNINSGCFAPEGTTYPAGTVHRRMSKSQCYDLYNNTQHEVAIHGYSHPFLEQLPASLATKEIADDRRNLEEMFSTIIRGGAYPFGTHSDTVVDILKNSGIAYCRTTKTTHSFALPKDWLRLDPTCHHRDEKLNELADSFLAPADSKRASKLFYVWGHTYEFDGSDNWYIIEEFCEKTGNKDDIWYCTNIELYDYIKAFDALEFSYDMSLVHNPTATTVWFDYNDKSYRVESGETKAL